MVRSHFQTVSPTLKRTDLPWSSNAIKSNGSLSAETSRAAAFATDRGEPLVVECGLAGSLDCVDDNELTGSSGKVVAVPEAPVVVEPVGYDLVLENESRSSSCPCVGRAAGARTKDRSRGARARHPRRWPRRTRSRGHSRWRLLMSEEEAE